MDARYINELGAMMARLDALLERSAELGVEHNAVLDEIERLANALSATAKLLAAGDLGDRANDGSQLDS